MAIFHLGAIFDACEGNGLTFTATFPWLECLIVLWVFFLFYPLPHHRHLSSFARPPPTPLSSCVIFWLTPPYPLIGWRNLWTAPNLSLLAWVVWWMGGLKQNYFNLNLSLSCNLRWSWARCSCHWSLSWPLVYFSDGQTGGRTGRSDNNAISALRCSCSWSWLELSLLIWEKIWIWKKFGVWKKFSVKKTFDKQLDF